MEFVIGYMMLPDVSPYFLFTPVDQWINFNEAMDIIPFHQLHILTCDTLLTPEPTDPCIQSLHGPV
jgi:hypothetical protein